MGAVNERRGWPGPVSRARSLVLPVCTTGMAPTACPAHPCSVGQGQGIPRASFLGLVCVLQYQALAVARDIPVNNLLGFPWVGRQQGRGSRAGSLPCLAGGHSPGGLAGFGTLCLLTNRLCPRWPRALVPGDGDHRLCRLQVASQVGLRCASVACGSPGHWDGTAH